MAVYEMVAGNAELAEGCAYSGGDAEMPHRVAEEESSNKGRTQHIIGP